MRRKSEEITIATVLINQFLTQELLGYDELEESN